METEHHRPKSDSQLPLCSAAVQVLSQSEAQFIPVQPALWLPECQFKLGLYGFELLLPITSKKPHGHEQHISREAHVCKGWGWKGGFIGWVALTHTAGACFGSYMGKQQLLLSVWKPLRVAQELKGIKSVHMYLCTSQIRI